jgi:hypothetical protein
LAQQAGFLFEEDLSHLRSRRFLLSLLSGFLKWRTARGAIANLFALIWLNKRGSFLKKILNFPTVSITIK